MRTSIILILILISISVQSQKEKGELIPVKGEVTAFNYYRLKNVEISAKKTKSKALTDSLGRFVILCRPGEALIFKASGFQTNRRKIGKDMEFFSVNMILLEGEKNRKVAVGYGYIDEKDLTHALTNLKDDNNDFAKYTTLEDLLRQELLGVRISGPPSLSVYIRGSENVMNPGLSTNTGAALFVVDGIPVNSIDMLNPRDIQSISLLKGSEAAIYGSRGANGVVLINTKR